MIQEIFKLLFFGVEFNQWRTSSIPKNHAMTELRIDAVCCRLRRLKLQQWHRMKENRQIKMQRTETGMEGFAVWRTENCDGVYAAPLAGERLHAAAADVFVAMYVNF